MITDVNDPVFQACLGYQKEVDSFARLYFPGWKNKSVLFSWEAPTKVDQEKIRLFLKENGFTGVNLFPAGTLQELAAPQDAETEFLQEGLLLTGKEDRAELIEIRKNREQKSGKGLFLAGMPAARVPEADWEEEDERVKVLMEAGFDLDLSGKYCSNTLLPLLRPDFFTVYAMVLRDGETAEARKRLQTFLDTNYYSSPLSCCRIHTVCGKAPLLMEEEALECFCRQKDTIWFPTGSELRDYMQAWQALRVSADGRKMINMSSVDLYLEVCGCPVKLPPGATLIQNNKWGEKPDIKLTFADTVPWQEQAAQERRTDAADGTLFFPGGKAKALSFSYDDGAVNDPLLIKILDKYGMKGTFNLNGSGVIGRIQNWKGWSLEVYKNHEIATHNFRHISFAVHPKEQILAEMYWDRRVLEALSGRIITGHAYASSSLAGAVQTAQDVLKVLGITYARVTSPSGESFAPPKKWLYWEPTCHHSLQGDLLEKGRLFLAKDDRKIHIMNVWGHVTELDRDKNYGMMEDFCQLMAAKKDSIFFATNGEIADYLQAWERCKFSRDGKTIRNRSFMTFFVAREGKIVPLAPGETLELA